MTERRLVPAAERFLDALMQLNSDCRLGFWSIGSYQATLRDPSCDFQLLFLKERLIGFYLARRLDDEAELLKIAVAPPFQHQGHGACLLKTCLGRARKAGCRTLFLEVRAGNRAATALYERMGFREVQVRKDYYRDPTEDARVLRLGLVRRLEE